MLVALTAQKIKFSIKDLVRFTEEVLNEKLRFLCCDSCFKCLFDHKYASWNNKRDMQKYLWSKYWGMIVFFSHSHPYISFLFVTVYKCSTDIAGKVNIHLNFRAVERCLILTSDVSNELQLHVLKIWKINTIHLYVWYQLMVKFRLLIQGQALILNMKKNRLSEVQKFLKLDFETFTNGLKCFINQNNLAMLQWRFSLPQIQIRCKQDLNLERT